MSEESISLLLIEDNPGDARLIREMLVEAKGSHFELMHTERLLEGLQLLEDGDYEVVLTDLDLPDSRGLDTLYKVFSKASEIPIIVLTGLDDETTGLKAVQEGAQDYLTKNNVDSDLLERSIRYAIERKMVAEEIEKAQRQQVEMRDQFLSHVSHELRSPLTPIYDYLTLILDGLAGDINEEQRHYLELIQKNVRHLGSMVEDLLDGVRSDSGKMTVRPQKTYLDELIRELIENYRTMASVKEIEDRKSVV